jgi:kynurenine formamidase
MQAELNFAGQKVRVAMDRGVSLAIPVEFGGAGPAQSGLGPAQSVARNGPRHFGAPPPESRPWSVGNFSGSVATGASCNCSTLTLIPHCQMTHTESVAHLTREAGDAWRVVPRGLLPAVVVSVSPEPARETSESTDPQPWGTDVLVTRRRLRAAWPMARPGFSIEPVAAIIRTLPNDAGKRTRDYTDVVPPYLTREAVEWLVEKRIEHLIVDLPSVDRTHDEGHLVGHRLFFGMPPGSHARGDAARSRATITELAFIPDEVADGPCILSLAVPAIGGDAVPSQPIVYPLAP